MQLPLYQLKQKPSPLPHRRDRFVFTLTDSLDIPVTDSVGSVVFDVVKTQIFIWVD